MVAIPLNSHAQARLRAYRIIHEIDDPQYLITILYWPLQGAGEPPTNQQAAGEAVASFRAHSS